MLHILDSLTGTQATVVLCVAMLAISLTSLAAAWLTISVLAVLITNILARSPIPATQTVGATPSATLKSSSSECSENTAIAFGRHFGSSNSNDEAHRITTSSQPTSFADNGSPQLGLKSSEAEMIDTWPPGQTLKNYVLAEAEQSATPENTLAKTSKKPCQLCNRIRKALKIKALVGGGAS